jgi:hypothetical protein
MMCCIGARVRYTGCIGCIACSGLMERIEGIGDKKAIGCDWTEVGVDSLLLCAAAERLVDSARASCCCGGAAVERLWW